MTPNLYECAECGRPVIVTSDGEIIRACGHDRATVYANRSSVLTGEGGVDDQPVTAT